MPINIPNKPMLKEPERAFALQKYLLLHSQHDAIQKQIHQVTASLSSPIPDPTSTAADRDRNFSVSSTSSSESNSSVPSLTQPDPHRRRDSLPRGFRFHREDRINSLPIVEEEEQKLKQVNQQIKMTLTDLLNCESVKSDSKYRMWVQKRLMDTEMELKQRRSRSCERRRSVEDVY